MFSKCFTGIQNLLKSLGNMLADADSLAEEKFKPYAKSLPISIVSGLIGSAATVFITSSNTSINNKLLEKCLVKQIMQYIPDKCDAKKVASDIIKNCTKTEGILNWEVNRYSTLSLEDGKTQLYGYNEKFSVNLDAKNSETLSYAKKLTSVFESKMVCGAVVIASVINLGFSIIEFFKISELTKTITGKQYSNELKKAIAKFKSHLTEIDISNIDDPLLIPKINYLKSNIESDKENLTQLLVKIKMDIKLLEQKKKESIFGACVSGALGIVSVVGTIATTGGTSLIYGLSTLGNLLSGGTHILNAYDCIEVIDELIKIQEKAKKESDEIEKQINKLKSMEKNVHYPNFYNAFLELLEKEKRKCEKFGL
jgi:hypothetical protein